MKFLAVARRFIMTIFMLLNTSILSGTLHHQHEPVIFKAPHTVALTKIINSTHTESELTKTLWRIGLRGVDTPTDTNLTVEYFGKAEEYKEDGYISVALAPISLAAPAGTAIFAAWDV